MNFFKKLTLLMTLLVHLGVYSSAETDECSAFQFRCDNGHCIRQEGLCNGRPDCDDESDENKCNSEHPPKCGKFYFQCATSKICIDHSWACDGEEDCRDASDERNCTPTCSDGEFQCLRIKQCIPLKSRCDVKIDCDDGSDELHCIGISRSCTNREFSCDEEFFCVSRNWLCDGEEDCDDGSDERICDNISSSSTIPTSTKQQTSASTPLPTKRTEQSCPDNYCMQNADCIVLKGQYYCNCSTPFTGEKCEIRITAERNSHDLGIVIGISMTLILLFISIALMLYYHCKRRSTRYSTQLISKTESQLPITSYSKELID